MRVELLYFDECPRWELARDRLQQALRRAGCDDAIECLPVETIEDAIATGLAGSPTIRINGRDPFATGTEEVALACRVYTTPDGVSGSPALDHLSAVLTDSHRDERVCGADYRSRPRRRSSTPASKVAL